MRGTVVAVLVVGMLAGCIDDGPSTPAEAFAWREVEATYGRPHSAQSWNLTVSGPEAVEGPYGEMMHVYRVTVQGQGSGAPFMQPLSFWLSADGHPVRERASYGWPGVGLTQWHTEPGLAPLGVAWALASSDRPHEVRWARDGPAWTADPVGPRAREAMHGEEPLRFDETLLVPALVHVDGRVWERTHLRLGERLDGADAWSDDLPPVLDSLGFPASTHTFAQGVAGRDVVEALRARSDDAAAFLEEGGCVALFSWNHGRTQKTIDGERQPHFFQVGLWRPGERQLWSLGYDAGDDLRYGLGAPVADRWSLRKEPAPSEMHGCLDEEVRVSDTALWADAEALCPEGPAAIRVHTIGLQDRWTAAWNAVCGPIEAPFPSAVTYELRRGARWSLLDGLDNL